MLKVLLKIEREEGKKGLLPAQQEKIKASLFYENIQQVNQQVEKVLSENIK